MITPRTLYPYKVLDNTYNFILSTVVSETNGSTDVNNDELRIYALKHAT